MKEGEKMRDIEKKILEQYCVEVDTVRKVRGGFSCETKQGTFLLKELSSSDKKISYVQFICKQLEESGHLYVDEILPNKEGCYVSAIEGESQKFILKKWVYGKECDVNKEREVLEATKMLAKLHNELDVVAKQVLDMQVNLEYDTRWDDFAGCYFLDELQRRNRELKKVRQFIRKKVTKGVFETIYLKEFQQVYDIAQEVVAWLSDSMYAQLYQDALHKGKMIHGDYNHHNIIIRDGMITITNFERFQVNIPGTDFYYFMRKVMEKKDWNHDLGRKMVEAYQSVRKLTDVELSYIGLRLLYPEKFWKITNYYYNSNKAWVSEKSVEKLKAATLQMEKKKKFIQEIFSLQNF